MDEIMKRLGSGRFWLTIITGVVFAYCSFTKVLNSEAISAIVSMVFISYFSRNRQGENGTLPMDKTQSGDLGNK